MGTRRAATDCSSRPRSAIGLSASAARRRRIRAAQLAAARPATAGSSGDEDEAGEACGTATAAASVGSSGDEDEAGWTCGNGTTTAAVAVRHRSGSRRVSWSESESARTLAMAREMDAALGMSIDSASSDGAPRNGTAAAAVMSTTGTASAPVTPAGYRKRRRRHTAVRSPQELLNGPAATAAIELLSAVVRRSEIVAVSGAMKRLNTGVVLKARSVLDQVHRAETHALALAASEAAAAAASAEAEGNAVMATVPEGATAAMEDAQTDRGAEVPNSVVCGDGTVANVFHTADSFDAASAYPPQPADGSAAGLDGVADADADHECARRTELMRTETARIDSGTRRFERDTNVPLHGVRLHTIMDFMDQHRNPYTDPTLPQSTPAASALGDGANGAASGLAVQAQSTRRRGAAAQSLRAATADLRDSDMKLFDLPRERYTRYLLSTERWSSRTAQACGSTDEQHAATLRSLDRLTPDHVRRVMTEAYGPFRACGMGQWCWAATLGHRDGEFPLMAYLSPEHYEMVVRTGLPLREALKLADELQRCHATEAAPAAGASGASTAAAPAAAAAAEGEWLPADESSGDGRSGGGPESEREDVQSFCYVCYLVLKNMDFWDNNSNEHRHRDIDPPFTFRVGAGGYAHTAMLRPEEGHIEGVSVPFRAFDAGQFVGVRVEPVHFQRTELDSAIAIEHPDGHVRAFRERSCCFFGGRSSLAGSTQSEPSVVEHTPLDSVAPPDLDLLLRFELNRRDGAATAGSTELTTHDVVFTPFAATMRHLRVGGYRSPYAPIPIEVLLASAELDAQPGTLAPAQRECVPDLSTPVVLDDEDDNDFVGADTHAEVHDTHDTHVAFHAARLRLAHVDALLPQWAAKLDAVISSAPRARGERRVPKNPLTVARICARLDAFRQSHAHLLAWFARRWRSGASVSDSALFREPALHTRVLPRTDGDVFPEDVQRARAPLSPAQRAQQVQPHRALRASSRSAHVLQRAPPHTRIQRLLARLPPTHVARRSGVHVFCEFDATVAWIIEGLRTAFDSFAATLWSAALSYCDWRCGLQRDALHQLVGTGTALLQHTTLAAALLRVHVASTLNVPALAAIVATTEPTASTRRAASECSHTDGPPRNTARDVAARYTTELTYYAWLFTLTHADMLRWMLQLGTHSDAAWMRPEPPRMLPATATCAATRDPLSGLISPRMRYAPYAHRCVHEGALPGTAREVASAGFLCDSSTRFWEWFYLIMKTLPRVCQRRKFHPKFRHFCRSNAAFLRFVLMLLRASFLGAYQHARARPGFDAALRLDQWFQSLLLTRRLHSGAVEDVVRQMRAMPHVCLSALREYIVYQVRLNSPYRLTVVRWFPGWINFERHVVRTMDHVRRMVGAGYTLDAIDSAVRPRTSVSRVHHWPAAGVGPQALVAAGVARADSAAHRVLDADDTDEAAVAAAAYDAAPMAPAGTTADTDVADTGATDTVDAGTAAAAAASLRKMVYRRGSGCFTAYMLARFAEINTDIARRRVPDSRMGGDAFAAIERYVQSKTPGSAVRIVWLADIGVSPDGVSAMRFVYAAFQMRSRVDYVRGIMSIVLSECDYELLNYFFHTVQQHNAVQCGVQDRRTAREQVTALHRRYRVPQKTQLPRNVRSMYFAPCCKSCKSFTAQDGMGYYSAQKMPFDPDSRAYVCSSKRAKPATRAATASPKTAATAAAASALEQQSAVFASPAAALAAAPEYAPPSNSRKHHTKFDVECGKIPVHRVDAVCHLVQHSRAVQHGRAVCTTYAICPRCATLGLYSITKYGPNGYSCCKCDAEERREFASPHCVACDLSLYDASLSQPRTAHRSAGAQSAARGAGGTQTEPPQWRAIRCIDDDDPAGTLRIARCVLCATCATRKIETLETLDGALFVSQLRDLALRDEYRARTDAEGVAQRLANHIQSLLRRIGGRIMPRADGDSDSATVLANDARRLLNPAWL